MKASCILAVVAVIGLGGVASAQQQVMVSAMTSVGGPGGASGRIPRSSLDKYTRLLALDDTQMEMARTLYEGYSGAHEAASKERKDQLGVLMRSIEETGDRGAQQEKTAEVMKAYRKKVSGLETSFMSDLRALLTEEQSARWPGVERMRRRELGLGHSGGVSGGSVDLIDVARSLDLDGPGLADALGQYEVELDRVMVERLDAKDEFDGSHPGGGSFDAGSLQSLMAESKEFGRRVRDINESFTRRVETQLAEGDRPAFLAEVRRRSFPQVYREPYAMKMYKAAQGFSDLTPDQKEQIGADLDRYRHELDTANSAWADAIAESEDDPGSGTVSMGGGTVISLRTGDEPRALTDARKARRELDQKFRDRLKDRLTKEQQDRLPKPEEEGQRHVVEGGAEVITIGGGG
ncbi:MAG: hypothetical protein IT437_05275 [Phycisphaerales bacterium]|nr:hypothetical protein [Phycisphaerales bacterium]